MSASVSRRGPAVPPPMAPLAWPGRAEASPDAALLGLCAEIAERQRIADAASAREKQLAASPGAAGTRDRALAMETARAQRLLARRRLLGRLRRAARLRARTSAGLSAKAALILTGNPGTWLLAVSLADDVVSCLAARGTVRAGGSEAGA